MVDSRVKAGRVLGCREPRVMAGRMSVHAPYQPFRIYINQPGENVQSFHPLRAFLPPLTGRSAQSGVTHVNLGICIPADEPEMAKQLEIIADIQDITACTPSWCITHVP